MDANSGAWWLTPELSASSLPRTLGQEEIHVHVHLCHGYFNEGACKGEVHELPTCFAVNLITPPLTKGITALPSSPIVRSFGDIITGMVSTSNGRSCTAPLWNHRYGGTRWG